MIQLTEAETQYLIYVLDKCRDAIQPLTLAQIKLHHIPMNLPELLDQQYELLAERKRESNHGLN